jgi:alkylhydroperoxidase family enzyme
VAARVPYRDAEDIIPFNIFRTLVHAPQVLKGYSDLGGRLLFKGTLDTRTRELVINAISVNLDCAYEWSHHVGMGREAGLTDDELRALRDGGWEKALSPAEAACVAYALKVDDRTVSDADVQALRDNHLSDEQIVELTVLAGFYGMTARYLLALGVEIDQDNPDFSVP